MVIQDAVHIGIIFDATNLDQREKVMQFSQDLKKKDFRVKLIGYFDHQIDSLSIPFKYFTIKDLNFSYIPNDSIAQEFMDKPFEVLINLAYDLILPIDYICTVSKAKFKVGPPNFKNADYDLIVESNGSLDMEQFIKDIRSTLGKIQ